MDIPAFSCKNSQKGFFLRHHLTLTISPEARGLMVEDGMITRWLEPGRHELSSGRPFYVHQFLVTEGHTHYTPELMAVAPEGYAEHVTLKPSQVAVLTRDGLPVGFLEPGQYILWQVRHEMRAWIYDVGEVVAPISDVFAPLVPASYMKTVQVNESQRALVYRDGVAVKWLEPGRHRLWARHHDITLKTLDVERSHIEATPEILALAPAGTVSELSVGPEELALIFEGGRLIATQGPGSYLVWQARVAREVKIYETRHARTLIPEHYWDQIPPSQLSTHTIQPYERGLLYVNGKFEELLMQGRYGVHEQGRDVLMHRVDMREQEFQIAGQEVMSADKVTLRINLIVKYRVVDALLSFEGHTSLHEALYTEVQMAARRLVSGEPLEGLLEARQQLREAMTRELSARARVWGVEVLQVDLKDLILPGEMKTLLNRVIEAQKQAEANVIIRREEAAATRAQANTAKTMANNQTMMRLKELEVLQGIAANISTLNVSVGQDAKLPLL